MPFLELDTHSFKSNSFGEDQEGPVKSRIYTRRLRHKHEGRDKFGLHYSREADKRDLPKMGQQGSQLLSEIEQNSNCE